MKSGINKNTDFTHSVVNKSALESNMFSNKRITLEGMIKVKGAEKGKSKEKEQIENIFKSTLKESKVSKEKKEYGVLTLLHNNESGNHKNRDLGEPTGRREVELLNKWLDKMLNSHVFSKNEIKKDPEKRKQALYHAKLILSIWLRDLIRQVSVLCLERGILIEKVVNNYINIFETETRGNMYDLDDLQAKHLKDILKIKADDGRNSNNSKVTSEQELQNQFAKYTKISHLEEELEEAKTEINKLKEEIKMKTTEFWKSVVEFKRRETMITQKMKNEGRRPQEWMESSESDTSSDKEEEMIRRIAQNVRNIKLIWFIEEN